MLLNVAGDTLYVSIKGKEGLGHLTVQHSDKTTEKVFLSTSRGVKKWQVLTLSPPLEV